MRDSIGSSTLAIVPFSRATVNYDGTSRYVASAGGKGIRRTRGIEENDAESSRAAPQRKGDEEESELRQGLLTDSDGYHFIRDTILRLPQPASLPSPSSSMPPTTDPI